MTQIKIGDYIRTYHHGICKIIDIKRFNEEDNEYITDTNKHLLLDTTNECISNNKNIMELIEENDWVNGHQIIEKFYDYANNEYHLVTGQRKHLFCEDIKDITTHEQIENEKYIVHK